jgi:hypothetical protein
MVEVLEHCFLKMLKENDNSGSADSNEEEVGSR